MPDAHPPTRGAGLPEDAEQIRRDTDEVFRLYGEFLRRLSHQGVRDIAEVVHLHEQLCRAVATVALPEIDFALVQIRGLVDRIRLIGLHLDRLGALKRALGDGIRTPRPERN